MNINFTIRPREATSRKGKSKSLFIENNFHRLFYDWLRRRQRKVEPISKLLDFIASSQFRSEDEEKGFKMSAKFKFAARKTCLSVR